MKTKFICEVDIFYKCPDEEREYHISEFIRLIEDFGEKVEISFISKGNIVSLLKFIAEIASVIKSLNSKVTLGYQYGENKSYKRGIIETNTFNYLGELGDDVFQRGFNKIYFVDNSKIICSAVRKNLEKNSPNSEIITINSEKKEIFGIISLNEKLKELQAKRLIKTKNS